MHTDLLTNKLCNKTHSHRAQPTVRQLTVIRHLQFAEVDLQSTDSASYLPFHTVTIGAV